MAASPCRIIWSATRRSCRREKSASTAAVRSRRSERTSTEELEYIPGRFVVNRVVRPRRACTCCEAIVQAPLPSRPIEKGRPGPSLLAHVLVSTHLVKIGEDVTETLEVIPRQWKVIQTVREKFSCRDCESIGQAPDAVPCHARAAGPVPNLLAMILFEKFGQHQPLNRQAERYAREGVDLSLSTLADQVGACCTVLDPIFRRLEAHVLAANRLHGDDTTVPVLAKGKTDTARLWTYVRDDRPFGGKDPPAAVFYYSRDRGGEHPQAHLADYAGILQADAYGRGA